ncbi:MAG: hypothetical protein ACR2J5_01790 [Geodermatophilaceae bacterium]
MGRPVGGWRSDCGEGVCPSGADRVLASRPSTGRPRDLATRAGRDLGGLRLLLPGSRRTQRPEAIAAFAEAALNVGTGRLVLLSGRGEEEASRAEQALQASGADWTVVRCSWFNQNFSESFALGPVLAGEVALPVDAVQEPFVDADDIADVAVAALTEDGHLGQVYELTGPRLLTFGQAVGEIAQASGRDISYLPISIEQFTAGLAEAGEPADLVRLLAYLFTEVLDGRNAQLTDGVQRALGREPRDFRDYARDAAATGVWASELAGRS